MGVNHFTFRKPRAISIIVVLILSLLLFGPFNTPKAHAAVANKTIVGYWHNFENGSGFIKLRDVSPKFDVINVSFAEPTAGVTNGAIGFTPFNYTDAEFKADVAYLQSQGKKVIISIGGRKRSSPAGQYGGP
nr:glycosyl hydrolase family 18 protein [Paenibacillus donghaensis]